MNAPLERAVADAQSASDALGFLKKILPATGLYCAARLVGKHFTNVACSSLDELAQQVLAYDAQGGASYFACASYKEREVPRIDGKDGTQFRVQRNVLSAKSFWCDLDTAPGTAQKYESQEAAIDGLLAFCEGAHLPVPLCVASGGGIHVYWVLTEAINAAAWKQTAGALKTLAAKLGFKADPACTSDSARVLRCPGTFNRKTGVPVPVEVFADAPEIPHEEFHQRVVAALESRGIAPPKVNAPRERTRDPVNATFEVQQNLPPFYSEKVADRCQQLRQMRDTRGCVSEGHWYAALCLMVHSADEDDLAHRWSSEHPDYSREDTDGKIAQARRATTGPTFCTTFEDRNPGGCDGCMFKGKISSPAILGGGHVPPSMQAPVADQKPGIIEQPAEQEATIPVVLGARPGTTAGQNPATVPDAIILPNDNYTFSQSAQTIFPRLAAAGRYYVRGHEVVALCDTDRGPALQPVDADQFRSLLDGLGCPVMAYAKHENDPTPALKLKRCSKDNAVALLASDEAHNSLPRIQLVSRSSVLTMRDGKATILGPGYHPDAGGILVTGADVPQSVALAEAADALRGLLVDYDFASPSDESRALAALVTPALRMGRLLHANPNAAAKYPITMIEANSPQTGKGHFQQLTCAVYGERAYLIAKKSGGVGSLDESIGCGLLAATPFVSLDNVRGRLDSQYLEMVLTCDGFTTARVPHRGEVTVDVRAVQFQMTSNGVDATSDLAARSSIIRLRKRPNGYQFEAWDEGPDLLSHVGRFQDYYLACVFAVLSAWLNAGRPMLESGGHHDFREWAGAMGWIVEKVFHAAPLLEGHKDAQERVSNPALTWLRQVCLAAEAASRLEEEMQAAAIAELCKNEDVDLPGLSSTADDDQAHKHVGKLFGRCFEEKTGSATVEIEGFQITRTESVKHDPIYRRPLTIKAYRIVRSAAPAQCAH